MSAIRDSLLREMGLTPIWKLRGPAGDHAESAGRASVAGDVELASVPPAEEPAMARRETDRGPAALEDAKTRKEPVAGPGEEARRARIAGLGWEELEADIASCSACRLCEQRRQVVPGMGDRAAEWMFVGEGPGAEEDRRGLPFVGPAGKLLDAMLDAVGLKRETSVYIANTVKCRPPHNRTPEAEEIAACRPYLERQIELVKPRLLIALGRPAAQTLLETEVRISSARGKLFEFRSIPVIVTYHPAYLLRNQQDKSKAWEDLCLARREVPISRVPSTDE